MRPPVEAFRPEDLDLAVLEGPLGKELYLLRLAIHEERLVPQLDDVAREADEPLYERDASAVRVPHHDDVAAPGHPRLHEPHLRERQADLVGRLPDENAVALEDRRLHGAGRDDVPVGEDRPARQDDGSHQDELADILEDLLAFLGRNETSHYEMKYILILKEIEKILVDTSRN